AEGYYAVGCALRLPDAEVYAFDVNPALCDICAEAAELNGVADRVTIAAEAPALDTIADRIVPGRTLLIVDVEGDETLLLDPQRAPALENTTIIVESHDFLGCKKPILLECFESTHEIHVISATARNPDNYPMLNLLSPRHRHLALYEFRPAPMEWLVMTPRPERIPPPRTAAPRRFVYHFDRVDKLDFDMFGFANREVTPTGTAFRWMNRKAAQFIVPINRTWDDVRVSCRILHAISPEVLHSLTLTVDGVQIDLTTVPDDDIGTRFTGIIPADPQHHSIYTTLCFEVDAVLSPAALGINNDTRTLGVAFSSLELKSSTEPQT
ncbi:MAG: hypothetical protein AAF653_16215, partial [Chloroflexota bacterium]